MKFNIFTRSQKASPDDSTIESQVNGESYTVVYHIPVGEGITVRIHNGWLGPGRRLKAFVDIQRAG
jgi:hypothetical protein